MMMQLKRPAAAVLAMALLLALGGCADNKSAEYEATIQQMQSKIDGLEQEKADLLEQVKALESQLEAQPDAEAPAAERAPEQAAPVGRAELIDTINAAINADNEAYEDYLAPLSVDDIGTITNGCEDYKFAIGTDINGSVNKIEFDFFGERRTLENGMDTVLSVKYYMYYFIGALDREYFDGVIEYFNNWFGSGISWQEVNSEYFHYTFMDSSSGDYYGYHIAIERIVA